MRDRPWTLPAKGIQILHDADQRTAVVIQLFETADDMAAAEGALDAMDPADTPGTRASIDRCEIKAEVERGKAAVAAVSRFGPQSETGDLS